MPKRVGYIFEKVVDVENISAAFDNALRRKKSQPSEFTRKVLENREAVIEAISIMLSDQTYIPSEPNCFQIRDGISGKVRDVQAPKIAPDQIIHWAIIMQIESIIMRGMFAHSCGSVPGRGPAHAKEYVEKKLRSPDGRTKYKYCLKLDIHHFFQSIDQSILIMLLKRKIKDQRLIDLLVLIIRSAKEGLPIGYYTSQWLSNFYLESFDHYVKEVLHVEMYVRYADDVVICGSNKRKLHRLFDSMQNFLKYHLGLDFKGNYQVFRVESRGIDFVGFRFYHDRTGIRKAILINIVRANRRCVGTATKHALISMISYYGYLDKTDTYVFQQNHLTGSKKYFIQRFKTLDENNVESERELKKLCS